MNYLKEKQRFLRDTAQHQMKVARDDGVYRHFIFQRPGSSTYRFDLITWPGYLCYTGDMGTFVFTRVYDMLEFFRKSSMESSIDFRYWAEKIESDDPDKGARQFDHAAFRREVRGCVRSFTSSMIDDVRGDSDEAKRVAVAAIKELRKAVAQDVLGSPDCEVRAFDAASDFLFHSKAYEYDIENWQQHFGDTQSFRLDEFYERDCKVYTLRFIWCCYALVWGIAQYDAAKRAQSEAQAVPA